MTNTAEPRTWCKLKIVGAKNITKPQEEYHFLYLCLLLSIYPDLRSEDLGYITKSHHFNSFLKNLYL